MPQLSIFNYTEKAQYEGHWTPETLLCRGLIVNTDTDEVLARPFGKFFNYGQPGAPEVGLSTELYAAYDKADGSLGIIYHIDDEDSPHYGLHVATRGSFVSDQAIWATKWLNDNWEGLYDDAVESIEEGFTPLVEIIYPENRIVLDYKGAKTLKHLGYVRMGDGFYTGVPEFNPILTALDYVEPIAGKYLSDVVSLPPRENAEGVVAWIDPYTAVKIKQADYVELHRIVTGLNRKSIWRALKEGPDEFDALMEKIPDELHSWANSVKDELYAAYKDIVDDADDFYTAVLEYLYLEELESNRKELALAVQKFVPAKYRGYMFSMADGRDIRDKVWASIEPRGGDR